MNITTKPTVKIQPRFPLAGKIGVLALAAAGFYAIAAQYAIFPMLAQRIPSAEKTFRNSQTLSVAEIESRLQRWTTDSCKSQAVRAYSDQATRQLIFSQEWVEKLDDANGWVAKQIDARALTEAEDKQAEIIRKFFAGLNAAKAPYFPSQGDTAEARELKASKRQDVVREYLKDHIDDWRDAQRATALLAWLPQNAQEKESDRRRAAIRKEVADLQAGKPVTPPAPAPAPQPVAEPAPVAAPAEPSTASEEQAPTPATATYTPTYGATTASAELPVYPDGRPNPYAMTQQQQKAYFTTLTARIARALKFKAPSIFEKPGTATEIAAARRNLQELIQTAPLLPNGAQNFSEARMARMEIEVRKIEKFY